MLDLGLTYIWGILGSIKGLSMVKMNELFLKKPKVLLKLVLSSPSFIEPFFHLLTDFNHRSIFGKVKFTSVRNPSDGNIWDWQWEGDQGRPDKREMAITLIQAWHVYNTDLCMFFTYIQKFYGTPRLTYSNQFWSNVILIGGHGDANYPELNSQT